MTTTLDTRTAAPPTTRRRQRLVAVLIATAAATLVWLVAVVALGIDLVAPMGPRTTGLEAVPIVAVLLTALLAAGAGWLALAVLERLTRRAATIWTVGAVALLVLSFGPTLSPIVPAESRAVLALLHLAVGVPVIVLFRRSSVAH